MLYLLQGRVSTNYLEFCIGDVSLLPICLFIYLSLCELTSIQFSFWFIIQYYIQLLKLFQLQLLELFQLVPVSFRLNTHHFFFEHFLIFWHQEMLHAHFVYFLSQPLNQQLLQEILVPFIGQWYYKAKSACLVCFLLLG